jgi:phenylalanyl-tRNA synthetase beta chain
MVMINSSVKEMNELIGRKLTLKAYEELCFRYGIDLDSDGTFLNFEITSDRTEMVSKHSIAFLLGQLLGAKVQRDERLRVIREKRITVRKTKRQYVNLLMVKLRKPVGENLNELIAIQEKLDNTVGRGRLNAAIGLFDIDKLKFPFVYEEREKSKVEFVPINEERAKKFGEILKETRQGRIYSKLTGDRPIVWTEGNGEIFAMPPIINAANSAVEAGTKNIFIDITGTDKASVNSLTTALIFNMQFFGRVDIIKPAMESKELDTSFSLGITYFYINEEHVSNLLGIRIKKMEIIKILNSLDYKTKTTGTDIRVTVPFYRQDIIHQVDIIDDIMRHHGVNNIVAREPKTLTIGAKLPYSAALEGIRDVLVGFGYQETDMNVLTNENFQFRKMHFNGSGYAPLIDIKSGEITMARVNVFPELLRFVSNNLNKRFPQKLFDIGYVLELDPKTDVEFANALRLSIMDCGLETNFSSVKAALDKIFKEVFGSEELKIDASDEKFKNTFIGGRHGTIIFKGKPIGMIGELHPRVLNEFGIELPVSVAEVSLSALL